jgi:predicted aminopeptidase
MEREPNVFPGLILAVLVLRSFSLLKHSILVVSVLIFSGCSGVRYVAENGIEQWKLFNRAKPVSEVLQSPYTTKEIRVALEQVKEAKDFSLELGLSATKNYESFVSLDGPCLVWAVSAANNLKLEERTWKFPIVGEVPYLGFFREDSAKRHGGRLMEQEDQPDVYIRCVPAFSSLGWFPDPIYSSMIKGRLRHIVDLVLHESFHATVWIPGSVDFNERLATFVGMEGSLRYLSIRVSAEEREKAEREIRGEKVFGLFLSQERERYLREVKDQDQKRRFYGGLAERYRQFIEAQQKMAPLIPLPVKLEGWNNATFLSYSNYFSDDSAFADLLRACGGNLKRFIATVVREKESGSLAHNPEESLKELAAKGPSACGD